MSTAFEPQISPDAATADTLAQMRWRLVSRVAAECAARGFRRIALYGGGRHTALFVRQPWSWHGVRVVAIVDDAPTAERIGGVPVVRPRDLNIPIDAVVVSSECYEHRLAERAEAEFGTRGTPVLRIYGDNARWEDDERTVVRLVRDWNVNETDARWLVANRGERHDATLPVLPPARTELHVRRYELAAKHVAGKRVADAACGTGYGSSLLLEQGRARNVIGVDIDARTIDYARRRFGRPQIEFRCASACDTALAKESVDVVTSFETIEHMHDPRLLIAEFARVLSPGGTLVISTPNEGELTEFHAQSFDGAALNSIIEERFDIVQRLGQRAGDAPACERLPAGIFASDDERWRAETLIVVAQKR